MEALSLGTRCRCWFRETDSLDPNVYLVQRLPLSRLWGESASGHTCQELRGPKLRLVHQLSPLPSVPLHPAAGGTKSLNLPIGASERSGALLTGTSLGSGFPFLPISATTSSAAHS